VSAEPGSPERGGTRAGAGRAGRAGAGTWIARLLLAAASIVATLAVAEAWLASAARRPLLVPTLAGRVSPEPGRDHFVPFDVELVPRRPRVVLIGASTEAGFPFGPRASLAAWVERVLAWRGASIEVVPLACPGLTAEQSEALVPDALALHPSAIVAGVGHNEFIYSVEQLPPRWWHHSHLARRLRGWQPADRASDVPLPTAARAFDAAAIEEDFRQVLRRMRAAADAAGVPLLLTVPVSNLLCPPALGDAAASAAQDADALFARGTELRAAGEHAAARTALEQALAADRWPQRATPALQDAVLQSGATVVRTDLALQAAAPDGIPGFGLFLDHCHPAPAGALVLATAIADAIEALGIAPPTGRAGTAPDLATMRGALDLPPAREAAARGDAALQCAGLAIVTGRTGALFQLADRQLAAAETGSTLPDAPEAGRIVLERSEASAWRAFLALLAGDVPAAQARLAALRRADARADAALGVACRHYPWIGALFVRHGLPVPGAD